MNAPKPGPNGTLEVLPEFETEFVVIAVQSIFGLSSCCDRAEFMFALVMTLVPISIVAGTCSRFQAARAVLFARDTNGQGDVTND
jgi:hypothetical protein